MNPTTNDLDVDLSLRGRAQRRILVEFIDRYTDSVMSSYVLLIIYLSYGVGTFLMCN